MTDDGRPGRVRVEQDSLGEVEVPVDALWGPQTQRAVENFPISGEPMPRGARSRPRPGQGGGRPANAALGVLDRRRRGRRSPRPPPRWPAGGTHDQFPVDVFQTGSGTSTNMNVNEVIATLAVEPLGRERAPQRRRQRVASRATTCSRPPCTSPPPTASRTTCCRRWTSWPPPCADAARARRRREGRAHPPDGRHARSRFGQEFGGYATQVELGHERLASSLPRVCELPAGRHRRRHRPQRAAGFAPAVIAELAEAYRAAAQPRRADHFEAQGARDALVELSGQLRTVAVSLTKIVNDLRLDRRPVRAPAWPRSTSPDLQPGSSIMPGKVNPVIPEAVLQVCAQVIGNDAAIAWAGASGAFELNVMMPVMARNLLESIASWPRPYGCSRIAASTAQRLTPSGCAATPRRPPPS